MNDECRKAFEAWRGDGNMMPEDQWLAWQAAWNYRTESKPVTREEIDDLAIELSTAAEKWAIGEDDRTKTLVADLKNILTVRIKALQPSATQAPVVPSVEPNDYEDDIWDRFAFMPIGEETRIMTYSVFRNAVQAIHAHLLATSGRESREDQYRQALERLRSLVTLEEALIGLSPNMANALEMIRGALATTNTKDPS